MRQVDEVRLAECMRWKLTKGCYALYLFLLFYADALVLFQRQTPSYVCMLATKRVTLHSDTLLDPASSENVDDGVCVQ